MEEKKLGQGAFGHVFVACRRPLSETKEPSTDCNYVVKVQKVGVEFSTEVKVLAAVASLAVAPRMFDHWECKGQAYMVSELMKEDLEDELNRTSSIAQSDIERVRTLLTMLHTKRIAWLDMASRNLLRGFDGLLYLSDFGVSLDYSGVDDEVGQQYRITQEDLTFPEAVELDWEQFRAWERDMSIWR